MTKTILTDDKTMQVNLFDEGMVEIESPVYKKIGIEITKLDVSVEDTGPKGALYRINVYVPQGSVKLHPFEYDTAWVMPDGTILHRNQRHLKRL
jgi:hypothetical protein